MLVLLRTRLERLRDQLRARGQRPSMILPHGIPASAKGRELAEAALIVEEYGAMCEAMYLMMAADQRLLNVEREVLRGALDVLSEGRVRTTHMDAMIDAAARKCAEEGTQKRLAKVLDELRGDPPERAELTVLLAAAVAAADNRIAPEESALLQEMFRGLGLDETRANDLLKELAEGLATPKPPPVGA